MESEPCGLIFPAKTRIDLANIVAHPVRMGELAILIQHPKKPVATSEVWLGRAEQARRIALMLSVKDAALLDGYAIECEAEAARLIAEPALRVAA
jgi:hypothetical protein